MANSFLFQDKSIGIGDSISMSYKIKEANKERQQIFSGIVIKVRGEGQNKMFTVRKISHSGIGIERIIPLASPNLVKIKSVKKGVTKRAKLYFIRKLSDQEVKHKIYHQK